MKSIETILNEYEALKLNEVIDFAKFNEYAKFILKQASEEQNRLSVEFIQAINALVMKSTGSVKNTVFGTIDERNGEFRKGNVSAGGSYFVNYDKVVPYTNELVNSLNEKLNKVKGSIHQLELAFSAHFDLVNIHAFYDGNGRTSRLLMNYIQAFYKLPLSIVYKEDKAYYIQALKDSRSEQNLMPFFKFMFSQLEKQLTTEIELYG